MLGYSGARSTGMRTGLVTLRADLAATELDDPDLVGEILATS